MILVFIFIVIGKLIINILNVYGGVMVLLIVFLGFIGKSSVFLKICFGFVIGFNVVVVLMVFVVLLDFL